jgi:hypothetical protein
MDFQVLMDIMRSALKKRRDNPDETLKKYTDLFFDF